MKIHLNDWVLLQSGHQKYVLEFMKEYGLCLDRYAVLNPDFFWFCWTEQQLNTKIKNTSLKGVVKCFGLNKESYC